MVKSTVNKSWTFDINVISDCFLILVYTYSQGRLNNNIGVHWGSYTCTTTLMDKTVKGQ